MSTTIDAIRDDIEDGLSSSDDPRSRSDERWILPLSRAAVLGDVGGKAWNLSRLIAMGQPVPDGFVLTRRAFDAFLEEDELDAAIGADCQTLDARSPETIRSAAERVEARVRARSLPSDVRAKIRRALAALSAHVVIVRSSAIGEDSGDASFAGQLDSIAGVEDVAAAERAIVGVWASRWSARALSYQLGRGRLLDGMGVILQKQIESTVSGVLFTVSPSSEHQILIEYCDGPGDALVAGRVDPSQVVVDRGTARTIRHEAPPSAPAAVVTLEPHHIRELAERALQIERAFGAPQDIEWTVDTAGRLWIVQSRPITVGVRPRSNARTIVWSNANVNENFPQPISPLLYSIARTGYYHYFRNLGIAFGLSKARIAAMEQPLRHIIGVHGARMYYNLTSIHGVLRSAPFGQHLAAWFNGFVGAEDTETPAFVDGTVRLKPDAARANREGRDATRVRQALEVAAIGAKTAWQYLFVTRRVERFERTVNAFAARTHPSQLEARSRLELLDDLRGFIDIRNNRWLDASLADAASMVCYGALERWLTRVCPDADQGGLHNTLLKALPDLPSSKPALELWALSRLVTADPRLSDLIAAAPAAVALDTIRRDPSFATFACALDRFLEQWGFRCSGELMLTVPSFQEDAAPLLEIVKAYAAQEGTSPADHLRAQQADRLRQTARVAGILRTRRLIPAVPVLNQWHATSLLLRWTQRAIVLRERARLEQALLYSRLRRVALALGERLVEQGCFSTRDDVFFLTAQEIDDLVSGASMFPHHVRALVEARRAWHTDMSATTPPDALRLPEGDYFSSAAPVSRSGSVIAVADSGTQLRGLGVCGGHSTARAAVLTDVTETDRLRPGDVLVTRQTDPGWGAVFPLISGLIMERGGMLSHGAIIAREFGIPSVVGVARATDVIPHGATVHVDGDRGVVRIEPSGEPASAARPQS